jgi:hypothetical protein
LLDDLLRERKTAVRFVRDNNAARVAGLGRICFWGLFGIAAFHPAEPPCILRKTEKATSPMKKPTLLIAFFLIVALFPTPSRAQAAEWHDDLADHLSGIWNVSGQVMGREAHHEVDTEWTLNHQFLKIHEKTAANAPASEHRYEAIWFMGYDAISERYVLHLIDIFGGRFSETLGYGVRNGNEIRFVFEYPEGPFHTTFRWAPEHATWQWLLEQKDKDGKWVTFADLRLTPGPRN